VNIQRSAGKEKTRRLDASRVQKLEELGFRWATVKRQYPWEAWFQQLKEFKEEHGHCSVPQKYLGGLGNWVAQQRFKGARQRLDASRTQKLEELGFQWRRTMSDPWEAQFRELEEFNEEHGHCNVPRKHPGGLGVWSKNQRSKKRSQCLDAGRVQKLEELGFQWETTKMMPDRWEARPRELNEFQEEHGHCNVPQRHPGGLGKWVSKQRYRGEEECRRLDAGRTQKLEELGFRWNLLRSD